MSVQRSKGVLPALASAQTPTPIPAQNDTHQKMPAGTPKHTAHTEEVVRKAREVQHEGVGHLREAGRRL